LTVIHERLREEVAQFALMGAPALIQQFVLRNGREYAAAKYVGDYRGQPKLCFKNAFHLTADRAPENIRLTYVEGYALRPALPVLIHHAWCVDEDGRVWDPTWTRPEEAEYFGVPINLLVLVEELLRIKYHGILDTPVGPNFEFMKAFDPGFGAVMEASIAATEDVWARHAALMGSRR
jgi:hypothetical protein